MHVLYLNSFLNQLWRFISIGLQDILVDAAVYFGQKLSEWTLVFLQAYPFELLLRLLSQPTINTMSLESTLQPSNLGWLLR